MCINLFEHSTWLANGRLRESLIEFVYVVASKFQYAVAFVSAALHLSDHDGTLFQTYSAVLPY
jgi:hypothetical protein